MLQIQDLTFDAWGRRFGIEDARDEKSRARTGGLWRVDPSQGLAI